MTGARASSMSIHFGMLGQITALLAEDLTVARISTRGAGRSFAASTSRAVCGAWVVVTQRASYSANSPRRPVFRVELSCWNDGDTDVTLTAARVEAYHPNRSRVIPVHSVEPSVVPANGHERVTVRTDRVADVPRSRTEVRVTLEANGAPLLATALIQSFERIPRREFRSGATR